GSRRLGRGTSGLPATQEGGATPHPVSRAAYWGAAKGSDRLTVKFAFGSQGLDPGSCPLLPGCGFSRRVGTAFERIVQRLGRRTSHRTSHGDSGYGDSGRVAGRRDGGPSGSQSPGAGSAPPAL